jgi:hypothetical protein
MEPGDQSSTKQSSLQISFTYLFIVDFDVTDSDLDGLIELLTGLVIQLLDSSWDDSSLLEVVAQPKHRVGLSTSGLAVAHDGAVVPLGHTLHQHICRNIVDIILSSIMKNLREFEFPSVGAVVNDTLVLLVNEDFQVLNKSVRHSNKLTPVAVLTVRFLLAYLSVGRVLTITLTACLDICFIF